MALITGEGGGVGGGVTTTPTAEAPYDYVYTYGPDGWGYYPVDFDGVVIGARVADKPSSSGSGPTRADTQTVQNADGTTSIVDMQTGQIISTIGTPQEPQPRQSEVVTVNGTAYEVTYNPDGTIKETKPVAGLPSQTQNRSTSIIVKNGNQVLIDTQTGEVIQDFGPVDADGVPDLKQFPDGSMRQYDKVTKTWTVIADAPPKDRTALEAAAMQIAANKAENAANRSFNAAENQKNREFQGAQSALDRELSLAVENARGKAEHEKTQVEAQKGLAEAVNSVDPTQYMAYLLAGGGTVGGGSLQASNAAGASAISDAALYPAARLLQQARSQYTPITMPGVGAPKGGVQQGGRKSRLGGRQARHGEESRGGIGQAAQGIGAQLMGIGQQQRQVGDEEIPVIPAARGFMGTVTSPTMFLAGEGGSPERVNITPTSGSLSSYLSGSTSPYLQSARSYLSGLQPTSTATGGGTTSPSGTSSLPLPPVASTSTGGAVRPSTTVGAPSGGVQSPAATNLPAAQTVPSRPPVVAPGSSPAPQGGTTPFIGGVFGQGAGLNITPADRAAMDEILKLRQGVKLPFAENYTSNLDFFNQIPDLQAAMYAGLQAKTGVGAANWRQQALRDLMALGGGERGIERGGISTAY